MSVADAPWQWDWRHTAADSQCATHVLFRYKTRWQAAETASRGLEGKLASVKVRNRKTQLHSTDGPHLTVQSTDLLTRTRLAYLYAMIYTQQADLNVSTAASARLVAQLGEHRSAIQAADTERHEARASAERANRDLTDCRRQLSELREEHSALQEHLHRQQREAEDAVCAAPLLVFSMPFLFVLTRVG